jgi:putative salt-induced outer membrane protein
MKIKTLAASLAAGLALAFAAPAMAQDGWTGEGALSAGVTSGNTKTTDVSAGLKVANQFGDWRAKGDFLAEYGENNSNETKNRYRLGAQLDRDFDANWYGYGRASYEKDKFAAFDNRTFVGVGAGVKVLQGAPTSWTLEAGPGYRWDELANGRDEESAAFRAASMFRHELNDAVAFTNDTEVLYADVSTQVFNSIGLQAKLTDTLSARVSYDIRHETEVLPGRKETDTATRVSLVYGF